MTESSADRELGLVVRRRRFSSRFELWLYRNRLNGKTADYLRGLTESLTDSPLFSIFMPSRAAGREMLNGLKSQFYRRFKLHIDEDGLPSLTERCEGDYFLYLPDAEHVPEPDMLLQLAWMIVSGVRPDVIVMRPFCLTRVLPLHHFTLEGCVFRRDAVVGHIEVDGLRLIKAECLGGGVRELNLPLLRCMPVSRGRFPSSRLEYIDLSGRCLRVLSISGGLKDDGGRRRKVAFDQFLASSPNVGLRVLAWLDGELRERYTVEGLSLKVFGREVDMRSESALRRFVAELTEEIRASGCEVVYVDGIDAFAGVCAAHGAGLPSVWSPGCGVAASLRTGMCAYGRLLLETAFSQANRIIVNMNDGLREYAEFDHYHTLELIYPGVGSLSRRNAETRAELGAADGCGVVMTSTECCCHRGLLDFCALSGSGDFPGVLFVVLVGGDGGVGGLELPGVRMVGMERSGRGIAELVAAADVFVCLSNMKELHVELLYAMGSGVAAVCTALGEHDGRFERAGVRLVELGGAAELAVAVKSALGDGGGSADGRDLVRRVFSERVMFGHYLRELSESALEDVNEVDIVESV